MKKNIFFYFAILIIYLSCNTKSHEKQEDFFPVLPFIQNDVADVDTNLYPIIKIISKDSLNADTFFVKREEFRELAKEFLEIPDLTLKKYKKLFLETKFLDQSLNRVIITYRPKYPEKEEIQRQEILIDPDYEANKVKSLIIEKTIVSGDSSIQKRMLWQIGKSFQITTIIQKSNGEERSNTIKVVWNEIQKN